MEIQQDVLTLAEKMRLLDLRGRIIDLTKCTQVELDSGDFDEEYSGGLSQFLSDLLAARSDFDRMILKKEV
jgi:hypothetical protein